MTAQEIITLRDTLRRTQKEMAHIVGTTTVTWSRWERGISKPMIVFQEKLEKLAMYTSKQTPTEDTL